MPPRIIIKNTLAVMRIFTLRFIIKILQIH